MVRANHLIIVHGLHKGYVPLFYSVDNRGCELKIDIVHVNYIRLKFFKNLRYFFVRFAGINYAKGIEKSFDTGRMKIHIACVSVGRISN